MRVRSLLWVAAALLLAAPAGAQEEATLVFANGRVFSAAADFRAMPATTVAIRGDRIVYVGSAAGAAPLRGKKTRWVELGGKAVLPGLVDAHAHLGNLGKSLSTVSLLGTESAEAAVARVVSAQKRVGTGVWIYGRGWDQNDWPDTAFPTWRDLAGTERNPVYLERVDGHALWVNRTALDACGINRDTPDPPGGRILRDPRGESTGILVDDAEQLVVARVPRPDAGEVEAQIELAVRECNRFGLVGVHDAGTNRAVLAALRRLASRGELTLNVYCMLDSDEPPLLQEQFATGPSREFGGRIVMRAIKLRADGALGSRGAALLRPYSDDPGNTGTNVDAPDSILYWTREAVRHGFQVATHAIGDRGNRLTLDIYEQVLRETQAQDARLRVEHCQILAPDDVHRFARLGVVASMQPTHATSDMPWAERRVGRDRIGGAYAWQTILQSGAALAFGSDFPVEAVNPLLGLYAAVTRQDAEGNPPGGWTPEQRLTLAQALRAFTAGAAYAAFDEQDSGEIMVGMRADLTILDRDLSSDPRDLLRARTAFTVVRGAIVWELRD